MGDWLPVVPESIVPLLPRSAQCMALLAREKAKEGRVMDGCVYMAYRRIGAALGLRMRRQIERVIDGYLAALEAVQSAA